MYVKYLVQSGDIQEVAVQPVETVGNGHSRICMYSTWYRVVTSRRSLSSLVRLLGMISCPACTDCWEWSQQDMYVQYLVQSGDIQKVAAQPVQTVGNGHSRICMYSTWYRVMTSRRSLLRLYRLLGMVTAGYVCTVPGTEW